MADSTEPKKETVRITVPSQQSQPSAMPTPPRDTVRIHLPTRPPANSPPPIDAPSAPRSAAAAMPVPISTPLKKETARITVLPDPPAKPAVQMKKTQPLIDLPPIEKPVTSVTVAPLPLSAPVKPAEKAQFAIDEVPVTLCWGLVAISAMVLILQIWNYLS
jgi:hypothetical protein